MRDKQSFDAFISYRHIEPDESIATALHRRLETYSLPAEVVGIGGTKRLRVFRDKDELAATADLGAQLREDLRRSRYLIVVCSPATPASRWIEEEVAGFLRLGRAESILCVLAKGELEATLPAGLRDRPVPFAVDVRAPTRADRRRRLHQESLRLVAAVAGCSYDDLKRRDSVRRKRRRLTGAILSLLSATAVVVGFSAFERERRLARDRSETAAILDQCQTALARAGSGDLLEAADIASKALRASREREGLHWAQVDAAMRQILAETPAHRLVPGLIPAELLALHPTGRAAAARSDGSIALCGVAGEEPVQIVGPGTRVGRLAFGEHARLLAFAQDDGSVSVIEVERRVLTPLLPAGSLGSTWAIAVHEGRGLVVISGMPPDSAGAGLLRFVHLDDPGREVLQPEESRIALFAFSADGRVLAWAQADGLVGRYLFEGVEIRKQDLGRLASPASCLAVDALGNRLAFAGETGGVLLWEECNTESPRSRTLESSDRFYCLSLDDRLGYLAAGGYLQRIAVWDLYGVTDKPLMVLTQRFPVQSLQFVQDARLVSWDRETLPVLWRLDCSTSPMSTTVDMPYRIDKVVFSPDGQAVACAGWNVAKIAALSSKSFRYRDVGSRRAAIGALAFDPSGRVLGIARVDGAVELWDAHTLDPVRTFELEARDLAHLRLGPGGESGNAWTADGRECPWPAGESVSPSSSEGLRLLAIGLDGTRAAADSRGRLLLLQGSGGAAGSVLAEALSEDQRVHSAAFTVDGRRLVVAGLRPALFVIDLATKRLSEVAGARDEVFSMDVDPSGEWLATGTRELRVEVRKLARLEDPPIVLLPNVPEAYAWPGHSNGKGTQDALAFSPDGRLLAAGFGGRAMQLWPTTKLLAESLEWMTAR